MRKTRILLSIFRRAVFYNKLKLKPLLFLYFFKSKYQVNNQVHCGITFKKNNYEF
jgi:hypothetical protein